ncbi:MAG: sulfite exporter TauE/SafE family protein [Vulcanimicrobiaceae bacterium]
MGIGGIFLIPVLVGAGYRLEEAIGTSLVTFTVTGIVATAIYARRSAIDWRSTALTSVGSFVGGPIGAKVSVWLPEIAVSACFAAFLFAIGVTTLLRREVVVGVARAAPVRLGWPALVACGAVVGIGSGLTGVGGPAILVPLLLLLKFPSSVAIGISQPNAIAASASGAFGHLLFGRIDFPLAAFLSVAAGAGVAIGAGIHRRVSGESLRKIVAAACIVLGLWLGGQLLQRLPGI